MKLQNIDQKKFKRAFESREQINFWFSESLLEKWYSKPTNKRGAQEKFSNEAIEVLALIQSIFGQSLRKTTKVLEGIFDYMDIELAIPNYSTLSRRIKKVSNLKGTDFIKSGNINIVVDENGVSLLSDEAWSNSMLREAKNWSRLEFNKETTKLSQYGSISESTPESKSSDYVFESRKNESIRSASIPPVNYPSSELELDNVSWSKPSDRRRFNSIYLQRKYLS